LEHDASTAKAAAWAPWRNRGLMIKAAVFMAITAFIVVWLIVWAGGQDVLQRIQSIPSGNLVAATLLTLILPLTHAWRFQAVLHAAGYPVRVRRAYQLTMGAWPISSITPSKSGDLVKAYYLRQQVPPAVTLGSLLAERAIDMTVLALLSLGGALVFGSTPILLFSLALLGAILAVFVLSPWLTRLPLKPSWRARVELLLSSARALSRTPRLFVTAVALTLANWFLTIAITFVLYDGVGAWVDPLYLAAGLPPSVIAGLAPFAIGGMGTRDSMLILLFAQYASTAQSLSVGILYAFFFRWLLSLLGIPFLQRLMREEPPP
jgi:uncharacterized membrane protein YbhN (UPF0104 family)